MALAKAERKKLQDIMDDPVKWAQAFLRAFDPITKEMKPWTARWYQVEMLRDKSTRKVYRCGRRIGKCLPGHVRIYDPTTGERIRVDELYKRGKAHLVTMTDDYKLSPHFTNEILDNGIHEVFRVTTKTGRHIDATGNHPLFTAHGWIPIDELKASDKVALASNMNFFGKQQISNKRINLLIDEVNKTNNVPDIVFKLTKKWTAVFLSKLKWLTNKDTSLIYLSNSNKTLTEDIQHLLLKFGINSSITKDKDIYLLTIDTIQDNSIPKDIYDLIEEDRLIQHIAISKLCNYESINSYNKTTDVQRSKLKEYAEVLNNDDLKAFADGEFIFDEIVSIESLGEMQTYDFSIPFTMNFVVEDFITHNTETMVVDMLHMAYTHRNFRILMAAPYDNQIRNMFTRLNELIAESPLVKQAVVSTTKNPAKIEFANGSMILGFTTGDDAASIRGQRADIFLTFYCKKLWITFIIMLYNNSITL